MRKAHSVGFCQHHALLIVGCMTKNEQKSWKRGDMNCKESWAETGGA